MSDQNSQRRGFGPMRGGPGGGPGAMLAAPVEKARDFRGTLRRLGLRLRPQAGRLSLVALCALASTAFAASAPKIMGLAVDELYRALRQGLGTVNFVLLTRILLVLAAIYLASSLFRYLMGWLLAGIAQRSVRGLRNDVAAKLHKLPIRWFDGRSHGDILSRVSNDLDTVANTLQQSLAELLTSLITMLAVAVMMLVISPLLTAVTILVLPLSILMTRTIARTSQRFFVRQQKVLGALNGHIEEMISAHQLVLAYGGEEASLRAFNHHNDELNTLGWKANFISGLIMPLMHIINNLGYIAVAVVGGIMVAGGALSLGDIQAFIQYSKQFGQPVIQISQVINIIQSTVAAAERVFEILDELEMSAEPEMEPSAVPLASAHALPDGLEELTEPVLAPLPAAKDLAVAPAAAFFAATTTPGAFTPPPAASTTRGEVIIRDLYFSYRKEEPLIEGLNLQVKPGQSVAIVGPTGAGKTTLVNLLLRFYETDSGSILVDGTDIRQLPREKLRSVFGMVLQDTWLFRGSIRANIAYGHDGAGEAAILRAATAARVDHFIRTLPDGYDTELNEEGSNISEGQKQLLTIARAFLADPAILILDEATSSVDTRTEVHIQHAMRELLHQRTSFIIAHRLSTIRDADIILVMNKGRIVESGTHQSLLAAQGFYADLYHGQYA